ncbi:MAG: hypothetical protein BMS9Abin11_0096 [Gammaproteobacteria bacterium]|nr:MAG: hypothetical protein BMS9Abin11_0096 [Gammaproteobacteria bacterium]
MAAIVAPPPSGRIVSIGVVQFVTNVVIIAGVFLFARGAAMVTAEHIRAVPIDVIPAAIMLGTTAYLTVMDLTMGMVAIIDHIMLITALIIGLTMDIPAPTIIVIMAVTRGV